MRTRERNRWKYKEVLFILLQQNSPIGETLPSRNRASFTSSRLQNKSLRKKKVSKKERKEGFFYFKFYI